MRIPGCAVLTVTSSDVDGGPPTYSIAGGVDAAHFAITAGGVLTFAAAPNFEAPIDTGANNVYNVTVQVSDGNGATPTQAIAVTVTGVNEVPGHAAPASVTLVEDVPHLLVGAEQLAVSDPEGDTLSVSLGVTRGVLELGSTTGLGSVTGNGSALLQFNGSVASLNAALATLQYRSNADFHGADAIAVAVSDGVLPSAGNVSLTISPVADAVPDHLSTAEDVPIGFNVLSGTNGASADAFEGNPVLVAVTQGVRGSVSFAADGGVVYSPDAGTSGADSFTYTVLSGGAEEVGNVNLDVVGSNSPPAASNLAAAETYTEDQVLDLVDIVASDADGGSLAVSLTLSNPSAGLLSVATAGSTTSSYDAGTGLWQANGPIAQVNALLAGVQFQPANDHAFGFSIATRVDDGATAVTGTKAVTATPVNDAPTLDAIADPAAIAIGAGPQVVLLTGIGMGGGETGQTLSIQAVSDNAALVPHPAVSYLSAQPTGSLGYTPVPGQQGAATITVTVNDGGGGDDSVVRTFVIRVGDRLFSNGFEL